jgi:DNA helicase-2/ATP-dependent DNA helicase PcrA
VAARWRHALVDDAQDLDHAHLRLVTLLAREHGGLTAAFDDDCSVRRMRGAAAKNARDLAHALPDARTLRLERSQRCPAAVAGAAQAVVSPLGDRMAKRLDAAPGGRVRFWRCASERAQAQGAAAEIERLVRGGVAPEAIAVLVRSVHDEGQAVAVALEERAVPYRLAGATAFFQRAEVKDVLAWLRLLVDPGDAGAVVRALARPPVELRAFDLARCVQIARRRRLDMVSALVAATESPQLPPEARERILGFLKLHRQVAAALDTTRPDLFVHRLVDRLGLRRQQLFAAQADVVERLLSLAQLGELAAAYVRRAPQATPREFARYASALADAGLREDDAAPRAHHAVAVMSLHAAQGSEFAHVFVLGLHAARMPGARRRIVEPIPDALLHEALPPDTRAAHAAAMRRLLHVAMTRPREGLVLAYAARTDRGAAQPPSAFAEEARAALGASWEERDEELFGPDEALHATFTVLRDELLAGLPRIGGRLGELRMDTDLGRRARRRALPRARQAGGAAAARRGPGGARRAGADQRRAPAGGDGAAARDPPDELARRARPRRRARRPRARGGHQRPRGALARAVPAQARRGATAERVGHRDVPDVPVEVQVRPRVPDPERADPLPALRDPRPPGAGALSPERRPHPRRAPGAARGRLAARRLRRLRGGAPAARQGRRRPAPLPRAHASRSPASRCGSSARSSSSSARTRCAAASTASTGSPAASSSCIDYKTGRPKTQAQLRDDVQLALYAVGAREAWRLEASQQAYLYVLDDTKVPLPTDDVDRAWITETVHEVADGILAQGFEPTPSYAACSMCDYRIACPACGALRTRRALRAGRRLERASAEVLDEGPPAPRRHTTAARGRPARAAPSPRRTGASSPAGPRSATRRRRATRRA